MMQPPKTRRSNKRFARVNSRRYLAHLAYMRRQDRGDVLTDLIATLYGNGEQGAMYIPQPVVLGQQVLFQDAAGTTAVTADGDPVGLMLDVSQGLELGPELATNGDFDTDIAGWLSIGGVAASWQGGSALISYDSSSGGLYQDVAVPADTWVSVSMRARRSAGTGTCTLRVAPDASFTADNKVTLTGGDYEEYHFALKANATTIRPYAQVVDGGAEIQLDYVKVRAVPGNHASQSTSAARRLYKTDGALHWLLDDLTDDAIVASLPDLGTNATVAYADASGVAITEGQTISGDTALPTTAETYGVIYLDRPLTASEEAKVTDYFNRLRGAA